MLLSFHMLFHLEMKDDIIRRIMNPRIKMQYHDDSMLTWCLYGRIGHVLENVIREISMYIGLFSEDLSRIQ